MLEMTFFFYAKLKLFTQSFKRVKNWNFSIWIHDFYMDILSSIDKRLITNFDRIARNNISIILCFKYKYAIEEICCRAW